MNFYKISHLFIEGSGECTGSAGDSRFTDVILVQRTNLAVAAKIMHGMIFTWRTSLDKAPRWKECTFYFMKEVKL